MRNERGPASAPHAPTGPTAQQATSSGTSVDTYAEVVLGERAGRVCVAFGRAPFRSEEGKYKHGEWQEMPYEWPAERSRLATDVQRELDFDEPVDVYVCPAVRQGGAKSRRQGDAIPPAVLWVDLDDEPADPELFARLVEAGSLVVSSGTGGHLHLYLPLTHPVDLGTFVLLNKALAVRLGGDAKWPDNSLLRLPGTLNWKPTVPEAGQQAGPPAAVDIVGHTPGQHDPAEMAQLLGVALATAASAASSPLPPAVQGEPLPDPLPALVREHLARPVGVDRSDEVARLLGACHRADLTAGQALTLLDRVPALAARYKDPQHMVDDVARLYGKFDLQEATAARPETGTHRPSDQAPTRRLKVTRASEVTMRRLRWLWDLRVVLGGLTLLAGREGIGKSTVAVWLVAAITRGQLDGELKGEPRTVVYVNSEDARDYTIVPRLLAAGADLERVIFVDAVMPGEQGEEHTGSITLPADAHLLAEAVTEHDAALVVLDAATSVIDSRLDGDKDRQMRQGLEAIGRKVGEHTGAAVLGIVHFGKRDSTDTGKLILGSIAWSQVARSVLAVALDEETGSLVISRTKGNLGMEPPSLAARIVSRAVVTEDGDTFVGRVELLGETEHDARDLLAGSETLDRDDRTDRDIGAEWLRDYLTRSGGAAKASEVMKAARAAEVPGGERTLQRARKKAGVTTRKAGDGWVWSIEQGDSSQPFSQGDSGHDAVTSEDVKTPTHVHVQTPCHLDALTPSEVADDPLPMRWRGTGLPA